ncbi:CCCH zinc finger domain protein [Ophiocordyceps sinensis CO18]|uniref:CCCH zinc finger domain protein n=1 Tax=Ophiocordyceps sinensis (strain Co18 / CGMCC 3.14243) TaxID=911162 RepID=T5AK55_OPHSC|nr:CCCH zinc finger domain protein [Ophiocordyceps sinensis CO18]
MFFFASQLRSVLSPQRSIDRPRPPPFCRRDQQPRLAKPFPACPSHHDVTESRPIQTHTFPRIARLPAMTLCKFYQQGNCKFGNSCRFEHPVRNQPQSNRFGALAAAGPAGGGGGVPNNHLLTKYNISADVITKDLTGEQMDTLRLCAWQRCPRPASFEEVRLHYMMGKTSGNEQQALSQAQELYQNAQQQMENALRNAQEAAQFVAEGENRHPNRHDVCREGTKGAPFGEFLGGRRPQPAANAPAQSNTFASGGGNAPPANAFGQPSALGQRPNPFGTPAFGQPAQQAQPSSAPFGQQTSGGVSAFSQVTQTVSGFGQPSTLGAKPNPFGTPTFGQPAQPAQPSTQSSAFGQPSALGNAFGQPSALGNAFGQPSDPRNAFGQPSAPGHAFGQPSGQGSVFGQPSQLAQKTNPFATNANIGGTKSSPFATIGNNDNSTPAANPFGTPGSNQANAAPSAFASAAVNQGNNAAGTFGPSSQAASPFGKPPTQAPNPFASAQQPPAQDAHNPFAQNAQPSTNGTSEQPANPFGQNTVQNVQQQAGASRPNPSSTPQTGQAPAAGPAASPYPPDSTRQHPPPESYINKGMDGRLATFKGKPVAYKGGRPGYRAFDGTWTRIWFPNGPPAYSKDTELPPQLYDDKCKAQWETFSQSGAFADGLMPTLPPPRECTQWDF